MAREVQAFSLCVAPVNRRGARVFDVFDRLIDFPLPKMCLRDNSRDGPTMLGNDDRLTVLDLVEQSRKVGPTIEP
jgi:hypothetical protein